MPATVVVGAPRGDDGKREILALLAQESDLVCRYQVGPNAGHTVVVEDEKPRRADEGARVGLLRARG